MADAKPNEIIEAFAEVIAKRLKTATKDQIADMFDLMFGKSLERLIKTGGIKQEKKPPQNKAEEAQVQKNKVSENKQDATPASQTNSKELVDEKPKKSLLQEVEKPTIIGGFSDGAIKDLKKILPESLSDVLKKLETSVTGLSGSLKGLSIGGGGGGGLLGVIGTIVSLFLLIDSIKDSGPFKGLKFLMGKLTLSSLGLVFDSIKGIFTKIKGFFDVLEKLAPKTATILKEGVEDIAKKSGFIARGIITPLKNFFIGIGDKLSGIIDNIIAPLKDFFSGITTRISKVVSGIFNTLKSKIFGVLGFLGKEAGEAGVNAAGATVSKTAGSGVFKKVVTWIGSKLKFIPFIGTIFTIASAWTRFQSGDIFGGAIDILSSLASLVPVVGTTLSLGLTALNAVLDFKAGGSDVKGGKAKPKGEIFWGWVKDLGKWIVEKIRLIPGAGDIIDGFGLIFQGKVEEGFEKLPIIGSIVKAFKNPAKEASDGNIFAQSIINPATEFIKNVTDFFNGMFDNLSQWLKNIIKYLPGFLVPDDIEKWAGAKENKESNKTPAGSNKTPAGSSKTVTQTKDALIDPQGGLVVSSPQEGELFQLSKNDGIAAGPWTNKTDVSVNIDDKLLAGIASNTKMTNEGLLQLASGFAALAKQLGLLADKANNGGAVVNNILSPQQSKQDSSADIVRKIGSTPINQFRQTLAQGYNPI